MMRTFALAIGLLIGLTAGAAAQGCGNQNPNCIVGTAPANDNSTRAASTAWVKANAPGGITSGAPSTGCAMGALVYTDPTTGNVRCDNQTTVVPDVFGLKITAEQFSGIGGSFDGVQTGALTSTGSLPDFSAGSCAVSSPLGSTLSGQFTAGACAGGTIVLTSNIIVTNGLSCMVNNQTSAARVIRQTATTNTPTATFTATINSGDVINYICVGY